MSNAVYLRFGKLFFAVAILAIGVIHPVTRNFPTGLMPVPANLSGRIILVYITGITLVLAGLMLLIEKFARCGAMVATIVWSLLFVLLDLPALIPHLHDPGPWTVTFETAGMLSGALMLLNGNNLYKLIAKYLFLSALIVFGIQHYIYLKFITTLIPGWLPGHLFWAWVVMIAFFGAALSILINIKVRLTALLLSLMFLLWVVILHLPRAFGSMNSEPEWTSLFVALAMCGVSLLLVAETTENTGGKK